MTNNICGLISGSNLSPILQDVSNLNLEASTLINEVNKLYGISGLPLGNDVSNIAFASHNYIAEGVSVLLNLSALDAKAKSLNDALTALAGSIPSSSNFVDVSSTQTIGGNKTVSNPLTLPNSNPTLDNQATRKKYVDDLVANLNTSLSASISSLSSSISTLTTTVNALSLTVNNSGLRCLNPAGQLVDLTSAGDVTLATPTVDFLVSELWVYVEESITGLLRTTSISVGYTGSMNQLFLNHDFSPTVGASIPPLNGHFDLYDLYLLNTASGTQKKKVLAGTAIKMRKVGAAPVTGGKIRVYVIGKEA